MPYLTDLTGLASVASAMTASLLLFPRVAQLPEPRKSAWLSAFFVLSLIPLGGLPLAGYVRGATGDLSITTQVLLWCVLLKPWLGGLFTQPNARRTLLSLIALTAIPFYPLALGFGTFDPYRIGYGAPLFLLVLLMLALSAWLTKSHLIALCISLATLAWSIGWHESDNLWDYLLDPLLAIYAILSITSVYSRKLFYRCRTLTHED